MTTHFYLLTPININNTPKPISRSLLKDSLSAIPIKPILIVKINIIGPTIASDALIITALSTALNFNISVAAVISINPEIIRKITIPRTAVSTAAIQFFTNTTPLLSRVVQAYERNTYLEQKNT